MKEISISTKLFSLYHSNKMGWFRLFGYGFTFKNLKIHNLTFSQRNKIKKYIKIGDWIFSYLSKN